MVATSEIATASGISLLVGLHFGELGVDDLLVWRLAAAARLRPRLRATALTAAGAALRGLRLLVHHLAELLRGLAEVLGLGFERFLGRFLLLQELLGVLQRGLDLALLVAADLVAVLAKRLLHAVHE